ncbi:hypothetical protein C0J52_18828 [Blattella germanica]|nr:hypothetical protein C0J52_18828 [Blattella germanica]
MCMQTDHHTHTGIQVVMLGVVLLSSVSSFATNLAAEYCQQQLTDLVLQPWIGRAKLIHLIKISLPAGIVLGCLLSWLPLRFLGRRATLQLVVAPLLSAGCCLTFVFHHLTSIMLPVWLLGIWIQGVALGVNFTAVPVYILETIRRPAFALIISTQASAAAGILMAQIIPQSSDSPYFALIPAAIISTSALALCFVTESPRWLLLFGQRIEQAKASLYLLNKCNEPNYNVCKVLVTYRTEEELFRNPNTRVIKMYLQALVISVCLMAIPQMSGSQAYDFYAAWTYKHAGFRTTNISVFNACERFIAVSAACLVLCFAGGRRSQCASLIISTGTISIALGATGLCLFSLDQGENWIWEVPWSPLAIHIVFQAAFWFGVGSQAFVAAFQATPSSLRPSVFSLAGCLHWLLHATSFKFLVFLLNALKPFGMFWFHAGVSSASLLLIVFGLVPEINKQSEEQ